MPFLFALDHDHRLDARDLRLLLGSKAASLSELAVGLGLPVPPGFTVSIDACHAHLRGDDPAPLVDELRHHLARLEAATETRLGDPDAPLLVAVRPSPVVPHAGGVSAVRNLGLHTPDGPPLSEEPFDQLVNVVTSMFDAWRHSRHRPRGVRPRGGDAMAVVVQAMVFADRDGRSCSGRFVTRDPATGAGGPAGEIEVVTQLDDGRIGRVGRPIGELEALAPEAALRLFEVAGVCARAARDMVAVEFVVERGELWILDVAPAERSGAAALRAAVEMTAADDLGISRAEALGLVTEEHLEQVLHPAFAGDGTAIASGLGASPGAAVGQVYFNADDAFDAYNRGEEVILVRVETSPEDVHGMEVSQGILTSRGGLASHAAVVARGWGIPAVVGAEAIEIGDSWFSVGGILVREGQVISINGSSGDVMLDAMATVEAAPPVEFEILLSWADDVRAGRLGVRANADTAIDAARARDFGAEGIGLCRTEHMFLGEERLPIVRRAILARTPAEESAALGDLVAVQQRDFEELFEAMDALPVTVRLLDPPLHEFLPGLDEVIAAEARGDELSEDEVALHAAARLWREQNPMLGTRGVRLGVLRPELYRTQVRALAAAVASRRAAGGQPIVEVMIPLVVSYEELAYMRAIVEDELMEQGTTESFVIGTMIETPRAALRAADIAHAADFFSFGTNDLTQMTFGFSRDDIEGRIMTRYLEEGLIAANPFDTVDVDGVGELVTLGTARGRATSPELKVGVCGEHGGDPASIALFVAAGVDYISCSPFRVPVARLAAAQALLEADNSPG